MNLQMLRMFFVATACKIQVPAMGSSIMRAETSHTLAHNERKIVDAHNLEAVQH